MTKTTKFVFPMPPALVQALASLPSDHKGNISLDDARRWCHAAHAEIGQTYGPRPYGFHLDAVEHAAVDWGFGDDVILRMLCQAHDVFEDTPKTYAEMLSAGFPSEVVVLAWRLMDEPGKDRCEKKSATLPKIAEDRRSVIGKMADRKANGLSSRREKPVKFARYCEEYPQFRSELFDATDTELAHAWAELDLLFGYSPE